MGEGRAIAEDGGLSAELAATLEPHLQDALNHPVRRQVLRVLHSRRGPFTVTELHGRLAALSRGGIRYHLQVLEDCGCAVEIGTRPGPLGREREMGSSLLEDPDVLRALEVMEAVDLKALADPAESHR